nr:hypothetical protein B0A51_16239 [Rachicladosporium sp. CCFEE 5018]
MPFGFGGSEKKSSDESQYAQNYPGENGYHHDYPPTGDVDSDLHVACPSTTTDSKMTRRIDIRLIPVLCILYLLAFLDRVNIGNANVYGLSKELGLKNVEYNTALVIFFVPYILFEIPSNLLLKKFKPHIWLAANMFMFGLVTVLQGLVKSYSGLLATRFFLGVFETGMFPGCFYLIGMYYRRAEAQKRFSFFFSSTTLAGAFGGLLAAAIGKMDGAANYAGWRWIFILEGALTVIVACIFFFVIPDFPEEAKWLTSEEKTYVVARLRADQGRSARERPITGKDILGVLSDYKVIVAGFMYFGLIVPAYGYAYFAPTIIKTFGYSPIQTQLHSVPPWAVAFAWAMFLATMSDAARHRWAFAVASILIGIAGFAILLAVHDNRSVQYAALFLVTMGTYSAMPITICWFNQNLGGHHRRSVGSAWQIGFGNIGGIIAVFAFLPGDSPKYVKGYAICIAFIILAIMACMVYGFACWSANKTRNKMTNSLDLTEDQKMELGDMSPDYRYLL